ncbi:unnamed protein product [Prunus armeniaca]|uniref:Cupin type-1 domain-containing protein n=1 Tax=Prunus armeniaca TaxID=36596 RepID=A0A6J5UW11_PRUAR|nr:hypothetical protein GBA52_017515 [Prunus armeniaca]CAB4280889.1 unnamed protein product [Prunus armeniaca]CAB4311299.1 unnamed protein product [Prunus armeniaca]
MNRVDFAPCGANPNRTQSLTLGASESGLVIERELLVGFVTTNNACNSKVLSAWQMIVVPRGLVRFRPNSNGHLPGSLVLSFHHAFNPDRALTEAFK